MSPEGAVDSSAVEGVDSDLVRDELPTSLVDHMEFYLLNYFKPAVYQQTPMVLAEGHGSIKLGALFNDPGEPE